jgi:hypothetical protein
MESLLVEEEVWSRETGITVQKGHNFWSDRLIVLKVSTVVSGGIFPCSTYGIRTRWREGLPRRTDITTKKGHKFWSDRWIELKLL